MHYVEKRPDAFLTHWGRMTHICISNQTIIGSDNGLSPGRRQAIIWTNAGILLFGTLGTNFSEILIGIQIFSYKKIHLKMSAKWLSFCLGLNVLKLFIPFPRSTNRHLDNIGAQLVIELFEFNSDYMML